MNRKIIFQMISLLLLMNFSFAQELPRSASFGAMVGDLNDSTRAALGLSSAGGTLIQKVVPGSSADKAKFLMHDVLVSMDGEKIENTPHFLQMLKKHHGGDEIKIGFYRNAKLKETGMTLMPKQKESSVDYEIIYSSVVSGGNHLRTIITKPKSGSNFPAVLIVGGVGCYSVDNSTLPEIASFKLWVDSLTANGYVTIRVEKTGMGDNQGIPCRECDFNTEKLGNLAGLKQVKSLPYVNKKRIFIAGFSIGGVIAPLLAQEEAVKGIIVYGTVGRNWLEYELENTSRQQILEGRQADSIDLYMRADYVRLYKLFVEKKQPQQILKEHPETAGHLMEYPMRIEYFQQVADINIRDLWMKTNVSVLAMHGASDFVSSSAEHRQIAEIVNQYHPGKAKYFEIPNSDHWSLSAASEMESYLNQQTGLNPLPLVKALEWLREIS